MPPNFEIVKSMPQQKKRLRITGLGHSTTLKEKYDEVQFVPKNFSAPMDLMCRSENGWVSPQAARWLHKISLLLVFVG